MAPLSRLALECGQSAEATWQLVAERVHAWASDHDCALRDCVVLVPFAQLLVPARAAFVRGGGWMPRVETGRTLARALGPEAQSGTNGPSFDTAVDYFAMHQLLDRQSWGRVWRKRDPAGFDAGIAHVVRTGHELARAAFGEHPDARAAYWSRVREVLAPTDGPGSQDRRLARIAAEWAALAQAPTTDRLFALLPAGWVAISTGSHDALVPNLLDAASRRGVPCLLIDALPGMDRSQQAVQPSADTPRLPCLQQFICKDFEDEAQIAAAQILRQLERRISPVALVAQDRVLVRRVRALLDRQAVSISDETGWKLSTTRAAARVMTLLRAARPGASSDEWLDWVKTGVAWPDLPAHSATQAVRALEAIARRRRLVLASDLVAASLEPMAHGLFARTQGALEALTPAREKLLGEWLTALGAALRRCGAYPGLSFDDAGQQVLRALRLDADGQNPLNDPTLAGDPVSLLDFTRWVDRALESKSFRPSEAASARPAQVVITPMAQAVLRSFAAVVLPGADARRLGAPAPAHPLLSQAQLVELGLTSADEARAAELCNFEHLLALAPVTVLRRLQDEGDPLGASPIVEQMALRIRRSAIFLPAVDPHTRVGVQRHPVSRSAPSAPALVPRRLSASGFESLRDCPYRFFARAMLRLREPEEIERDLEKRDYGSWLHAVLNRFHVDRTGAEPAQAEEMRLLALALELETALRLEPAEFLPFRASFRALAPRYVAWLHERDRQGWRWAEGEFDVALDLPDPVGLTLEGQLDRIDVGLDEDGVELVQLIDYKTGNLESLKRRVNDPLEDTQLAFYAALLRARSGSVPQAGYLALDSKQIEWVEHRNVARSATALISGLGAEFVRLRQGAALPALGAGETCDRCEMRGLCRRDDWAATVGDST
jgi:ATP-dependent helicase/nuclease subunit B